MNPFLLSKHKADIPLKAAKVISSGLIIEHKPKALDRLYHCAIEGSANSFQFQLLISGADLVSAWRFLSLAMVLTKRLLVASQFLFQRAIRSLQADFVQNNRHSGDVQPLK